MKVGKLNPVQLRTVKNLDCLLDYEMEAITRNKDQLFMLGINLLGKIKRHLPRTYYLIHKELKAAITTVRSPLYNPLVWPKVFWQWQTNYGASQHAAKTGQVIRANDRAMPVDLRSSQKFTRTRGGMLVILGLYNQILKAICEATADPLVISEADKPEESWAGSHLDFLDDQPEAFGLPLPSNTLWVSLHPAQTVKFTHELGRVVHDARRAIVDTAAGAAGGVAGGAFAVEGPLANAFEGLSAGTDGGSFAADKASHFTGAGHQRVKPGAKFATTYFTLRISLYDPSGDKYSIDTGLTSLTKGTLQEILGARFAICTQ